MPVLNAQGGDIYFLPAIEHCLLPAGEECRDDPARCVPPFMMPLPLVPVATITFRSLKM